MTPPTESLAPSMPFVVTARRPRRRFWSWQVLREIGVQAARGLIDHRLRAGLSMLGISWGIVSVVVLLAYGNGFRGALEYGLYNAFSFGTVVVWPGQTSMQAGGERAGKRVRLTLGDVDAVRELPLIKAASPEYVERPTIAYDGKQGTWAVRGVAASYARMRQERAGQGQGRFVNDEDVYNHRKVAFLGSNVARKLFGTRPAVGETITIAGLPLEIVGVMDDKVQLSSYFAPDKECVFVPYTAMSQFSDTEYLDTLVFQTVDPSTQQRALSQVRATLAKRHRYNPSDERAVIMHDTVEMMKEIGGMTNGLSMVLTFIGILTLLIGGVGVMNIMFVSVTERTREIGIRKALGARRREILFQFMLEALVTAVLGGAIGVALSSIVVQAMSPQPFLAEILDDLTRKTDI